jgi:hypothetical protein
MIARLLRVAGESTGPNVLRRAILSRMDLNGFGVQVQVAADDRTALLRALAAGHGL